MDIQSDDRRVWFYYANNQQVGPMLENELREAIAEGLVDVEDYVYREGFADWKHLKEVPVLTGQATIKTDHLKTIKAAKTRDKRSAGKRVAILAKVVAHNDSNVATGTIKNISKTGVFLETADKVFKLNEEVKLTLKEGKGLGKPMHLKGIVVRQAGEPDNQAGYGLELTGLDEGARVRINEYIKRNQMT